MKNILVTRLRFMGDIILTTPLLAALKQNYPDAKISYLAETPYISLLENHPHVDELLPLVRSDSAETAKLYSKVLFKKYDLAIDLFGNPRSALLTWLSSAKIRIGGDFRGRRHFYTHPIKNDGSAKSAIEFHLSYLAPLNFNFEATKPTIYPTESELLWVQKFLEQNNFDLNKTIIGIHPGATWPAKKWFSERFAQTANKLVKDGNQVLFTMGPGEDKLLENVISQCDFRPVKPQVLSLRQLAAVLKKLSLYISNDCGPLHLAPAVGTHTVGIFGPGEPDIWFPYPAEDGHRLVFHEIDCSRCHRDLCDKMDCMKSISVEKVVSAVKDSLGERYGQ